MGKFNHQTDQNETAFVAQHYEFTSCQRYLLRDAGTLGRSARHRRSQSRLGNYLIHRRFRPRPADCISELYLTLLQYFTGCVIGILSLVIFGPVEWILPFALALTVLVCTNLIKTPGSWKIGPATTALVLTAALVEKSSAIGFQQSLHRAEEVLLDSLVALLLSWGTSKIRSPRSANPPD